MTGEVPQRPLVSTAVVSVPLSSGPPAMPTPDMPAATRAYYAPVLEPAAPCVTNVREPRRRMCPGGGEDIESHPADPNFFRCDRHGVSLFIKPPNPDHVPARSVDLPARFRQPSP
ncbi:hypothetical protein ACFY1P_15935 [Streptomyces sp. NPDC001407]|uniref:hypothetical protein n=1 Tax=Streptomyces sp. NPDC001407 TaxID=3364573 RepID=UPI0036A7C726